MHPPPGNLFKAPLFRFGNHHPPKNERQYAHTGEDPERRARRAEGFFEMAHEWTEELIRQVG